jgi:2,3-bisphosphoglycerate-dependent phosphoglycerate mutase
VETLYLARHAAAGSNRDGLASCSIPGLGLTPEGLAQARALGDSLAGEEISLGVASELRRTQETIGIALEGRDVTTLVIPELDEIHFGSFDGGPLAEYRAWAAAHAPDLRAPGDGESRAQAAVRFARGLRRVLERPEPTILLVGHALCIRYFLDGAEGLVPAPLMVPIDHASAHRLTAAEAVAAAELLEEWSRAPEFRPLPV